MKKGLVVYYSWSSKTHQLAKKIAEECNGTLFEILTKEPYTKDYNALTRQAKKEIQEGYLPELMENHEIDEYDTIFIGSPNWWGTMSPPIMSFIKKHDFSGKTVIPFCTHGGGGQQRVLTDIQAACKKENTKIGLYLSSSEVNTSDKTIKEWIKNLG